MQDANPFYLNEHLVKAEQNEQLELLAEERTRERLVDISSDELLSTINELSDDKDLALFDDITRSIKQSAQHPSPLNEMQLGAAFHNYIQHIIFEQENN